MYKELGERKHIKTTQKEQGTTTHPSTNAPTYQMPPNITIQLWSQLCLSNYHVVGSLRWQASFIKKPYTPIHEPTYTSNPAKYNSPDMRWYRVVGSCDYWVFFLYCQRALYKSSKFGNREPWGGYD